MGLATCSEWYMPYDFCVDILIQNKEVLFLLCQDFFYAMNMYCLVKSIIYTTINISEFFFHPFNKELR